MEENAPDQVNRIRTALRADYERVQMLVAEDQLHECVDLLQNPDVLTTELLHACAAIDETWEVPRPNDGNESEIGLGRFSPGCDIDVIGGDPSSFRCITAGYDPQTGREVGEPDRCGGLDYIGLLKSGDPRATIGVVESLGDCTPYLLLLRLLACFTEVAAPTPARFLDRTLFKGALGDSPVFDLHLVLWDTGDGVGAISEEHQALHELTHDLAQLAYNACRATYGLSESLGSIWCLRVDPNDLMANLAFEWRI